MLWTTHAATIDHEHRAVHVDARGSAASLAQWEELAAPEGPPAELQLGIKNRMWGLLLPGLYCRTYTINIYINNTYILL